MEGEIVKLRSLLEEDKLAEAMRKEEYISEIYDKEKYKELYEKNRDLFELIRFEKEREHIKKVAFNIIDMKVE